MITLAVCAMWWCFGRTTPGWLDQPPWPPISLLHKMIFLHHWSWLTLWFSDLFDVTLVCDHCVISSICSTLSIVYEFSTFRYTIIWAFKRTRRVLFLSCVFVVFWETNCSRPQKHFIDIQCSENKFFSGKRYIALHMCSLDYVAKNLRDVPSKNCRKE